MRTPSRAFQDEIPGPIRAQLLALGIPAGLQTADGLSSYFPRDFNIGAVGLDAENVARVLIHLASNGIIAVPATGASTLIKDVRPGWHFCQFYRDEAQLLSLLVPYMADGLRGREACLWILPPSVTRDAAVAALARSVKDVEARLALGQLELLDNRSWYLNASGGLKSWEELAGALLAKQDRALAKGYRSLRAAGDAGWVSGSEASRDFIEYELKINAEIGKTKTAAVCTFRADVTADELIAIVTAHQDALYRERPPAS